MHYIINLQSNSVFQNMILTMQQVEKSERYEQKSLLTSDINAYVHIQVAYALTIEIKTLLTFRLYRVIKESLCTR